VEEIPGTSPSPLLKVGLRRKYLEKKKKQGLLREGVAKKLWGYSNVSS